MTDLPTINKLGVWRLHPSALIRQWYGGLGAGLEKVEIKSIWEFRGGLKASLMDPASFRELYAVPQQRPNNYVDLLSQTRDYNLFDLAFEMSSTPAGVLTIIGARRMLMATVYADLIRGMKFKCCKRGDCGRPFAVESKHKRKFCCQYCAHLESVRKGRRKK